MIANDCHFELLESRRRRRRFRCAFELPNHDPSVVRHEAEIREHLHHLVADVVAEWSINENQAEGFPLLRELRQRPAQIGGENLAAVRQAKGREIFADDGSRGFRRIDKGRVRGAARESLEAERTAAGKDIEDREPREIEPYQQSREDRFAYPRGRGTGGEPGRRLELSSARMSRDYLHVKKYLRSPNVFTNYRQRDR
jgi:hypothetical protein